MNSMVFMRGVTGVNQEVLLNLQLMYKLVGGFGPRFVRLGNRRTTAKRFP